MSTGRGEALEMSPRLVAAGLLVCLAAAATLLTKQIYFSRIATRDACGYYLPLAKAAAQGRAAQHPIIPPLYPLAMGRVSALLSFAEDPQELAGRLISAVSVLLLVVCSFAIGKRLFHPRVGLAAAMLTACNPWIIRFGGNVGPAMMYAVLVMLTVLLIIEYGRRGSIVLAVLAGLSSALAAMTRSEGIFLPPLAAIFVLIGSRAKRRPVRPAAMHAAALLLTVAVVWTPRLLAVRAMTGVALLDVRAISLIPWADLQTDPAWSRMPMQVAPTIRLAPPSAAAITLRDVVSICHESLFMVIGPLTWGFGIIWFLRRKNLPRRSLGQLIIASVIIAEICIVIPVKLDRRYIASVAGLAQIWGALGMVVLAERLRYKRGWPGWLGRSIGLQLAAMAVAMVSLILWSIFGTNVGTRHHDLRQLGQEARQRYGRGRILLATSPEPAYYARGRLVTVRDIRGHATGLTVHQLRDLCRRHDVDLIVIRSRERWCPWLLESIDGGDLPPGSIVATATSGRKGGRASRRITSYLIDAAVLFPGLDARRAGPLKSTAGESAARPL